MKTTKQSKLHGAVVELYNHFEKGRRFPMNGFYVARYIEGRRVATLADFGRDEQAARDYAANWVQS